MKRQRRTFTKEFKTEIVKQILADHKVKDLISKERNISLPLLERWTNDYLASNKKSVIANLVPTERRKDYQSVQELKAKIADLYMTIDSLRKGGGFVPLQKGA